MLIIGRKVEEQISIGDGIVVKVLSVRGHKVQLGLEAPRAVPIVRDELIRHSLSAPWNGASASETVKGNTK